MADRIGIIGVGEMGRAMVDGLCDGARKPTEIHLSARSATSWLSAHTRTFG